MYAFFYSTCGHYGHVIGKLEAKIPLFSLAFCKNVPNLTQLRGRLLLLRTQALYICGV